MSLNRQLLAALRGHLAGSKTRPPEAGVFLWNAFNQLSRQRSWHAHGPNPISYPEIEAFCRLTRLPLEPRHVAILRAMDAVWIDHAMTKLKTGAGGKTIGEVSKQPLSAALFDAVTG